MALEHETLTERIIGAAIEAHRRLGPGFLESDYEQALIIDVRFVVVRSQLKAVGRQHGLLLNFAKTTREPKRVIASRDSSCLPYFDRLNLKHAPAAQTNKPDAAHDPHLPPVSTPSQMHAVNAPKCTGRQRHRS